MTIRWSSTTTFDGVRSLIAAGLAALLIGLAALPAMADATVPDRAYEMVTPPFKYGGSGAGLGGGLGAEGNQANPGIPARAGDAYLWGVVWTALDPDLAQTFAGDRMVFTRDEEAGRWVGRSMNTLRTHLDWQTALAWLKPTGLAADLSLASFMSNHPLDFSLDPPGSGLLHFVTHKFDTGQGGYTAWTSNPASQNLPYPAINPGAVSTIADVALVDDTGMRMLRWGNYRGLLGSTVEEDASNAQLEGATATTGGHPGGRTVYLQTEPPSGPLVLINGCTGTVAGGDATAIPLRTADAKIAASPCEEGEPVSLRGAAAGGGSAQGTDYGGPAANALSADGRRAFFMAPDPRATSVPTTACTTATPPANPTNCPPQLYVWQKRSNGEPVVRWISRSRVANQDISLFGRGAAFQGAAKDGSVVYFQTNAPLTPDDPNATGSPPVTTGSASNSSWDLYRYELPRSYDTSPDQGALTRISGGHGGIDDVSVGSSNTGHTSARFISEDGDRVYFVTTAPLTGATNDKPENVAEGPAGSVANTQLRNIYLYDHRKSGIARWKFVAQIPFSNSNPAGGSATARNSCASSLSAPSYDLSVAGGGRVGVNNSCVRGSRDGRYLLFGTLGQITTDDSDSAYDLYLYDAEADEMTRISAPPEGEQPYVCSTTSNGNPTAYCNANLGFDLDNTQPALTGSMDTYRGLDGARYDNFAINEDGSVSVFFATKLALHPDDVNEGYWDVYEWREGEIHLISPGDSPDNSFYSGASDDGTDIFFLTSKRIDPREIDDGDFDIYVARRGGGFPPPEPAPVPCDAVTGACQNPSVSPPAPESVSGERRQISPPPKPRLRIVRVGPVGRKALAKQGRVRTRVRVIAGSGTVAARSVVSRFGQRRGSVGPIRFRRVEPGETVTLALPLRAGARRALRRGQRPLRLQVRVNFAGVRATQTLRIKGVNR